VACELTYQEVLQRRRGQYEHAIHIQPAHIVANLTVGVHLSEPDGIQSLAVTAPPGGPPATVSDSVAPAAARRVLYAVDASQQMAVHPKTGIAGDLSIIYECVVPGRDAGLVQVSGGYFAHYFAPAGLPRLPKRLVFVLDVSGSMSGSKIDQTRAAFTTILQQVSDDDQLGIIVFSTGTEAWPATGELRTVDAAAKDAALAWTLERLVADGGTNIYGALMQAVDMCSPKAPGLVVFLTDGDPSAGEVTDPKGILARVSEAAQGRATIFSLGFGYNIDFAFLSGLSARTQGFARQIHPQRDPTSQLETFYEEIRSPLLYNVQATYPAAAVNLSSLTRTSFAQYFEGSELLVAGQLEPEVAAEWTLSVSGQSAGSQTETLVKVVNASAESRPPAAVVDSPPTDFVERLYAHLRIRDLLNRGLAAGDQAEAEVLQAQALALALQYHLVTPLTSFIIVQDNEVRPPTDDERAMGGQMMAMMDSSISRAASTRPVTWALLPLLFLLLPLWPGPL